MNAPKPTTLAEDVRAQPDADFQENPANGGWVTADWVLCYASKVLNSWPIATKLASSLINVRGVTDMALQENPSNERLDTVDKKHCSSSTVPVIINRSQKKHSQKTWRECHIWVFMKIPKINPRYYVLQIKCP